MRGQERFSHLEISIRHDLQCLVDTLFSHIVNTILKPASERMAQKMSAAEDIDQMTEVHESFIYTIQTQCLLTKNLTPIYHAIISLLEHGVRFADLRRQHISKSGLTTNNGKKTRNKTRRRSAVRHGRQLETDNSLSSDESDENDKDPDYDADTEKLSGNEGSYAERLQKMKEEVVRLRTFVVTGLRGISRAGGEPTWEMLAEQLDWGNFEVTR
jgi:gamma-tubulin complex component 5